MLVMKHENGRRRFELKPRFQIKFYYMNSINRLFRRSQPFDCHVASL